MKTKNYRTGTQACKSYLKPAGNGWEVGFKFGPKATFVGNFVNSKEANEWYRMMNNEIRSFAKRYRVSPKFSKARYGHFLTAHLYNKYYTFINKCLSANKRTWTKELNKDLRTFRRLSKNTAPREKVVLLKAA